LFFLCFTHRTACPPSASETVPRHTRRCRAYEISERYVEAAKPKRDDAELITLANAGYFEVVAPLELHRVLDYSKK
jgi:hypothetical protein